MVWDAINLNRCNYVKSPERHERFVFNDYQVCVRRVCSWFAPLTASINAFIDADYSSGRFREAVSMNTHTRTASLTWICVYIYIPRVEEIEIPTDIPPTCARGELLLPAYSTARCCCDPHRTCTHTHLETTHREI